MIGRVVLAALLAGIAAGIILGLVQYVRITPLILAAEKYQNVGAVPVETAASTARTAMEHEHGAEWQPGDGLPRTLFTTMASALAGAGFALLLAGVSFLTGIRITPQNGLIWGLCGFLAVAVAPGAGLPPELPAMPAAELLPRQLWWVGTIAATGAALYLIAVRKELWAMALAVILIAAPHVIGAPQPATFETPIPAGLATEFAANSVAAAAVFWSLIGLFLGYALQRFTGEIHAS
jgi:cobalt transporter subunit CbtA